jgi:ribosomal protein S18 acetylase RimI-like enzyme
VRVTLEIAGIAELTGVATLPESCRQGVAASVSSALCEAHFQVGDDAAQACYEKIGFRLIGGRINYRREPSSSQTIKLDNQKGSSIEDSSLFDWV